MSSITSGKNNGMYGKKHSKETIEKMKKNKKKLFKENNPNYGNIDEKARNGIKVYKYIIKERLRDGNNCTKVRWNFNG
jgi:hypothetical protein